MGLIKARRGGNGDWERVCREWPFGLALKNHCKAFYQDAKKGGGLPTNGAGPAQPGGKRTDLCTGTAIFTP